ncbi:hypothetical protein B8W85_13195, partial [Lentilactobacillus kefiri]
FVHGVVQNSPVQQGGNLVVFVFQRKGGPDFVRQGIHNLLVAFGTEQLQVAQNAAHSRFRVQAVRQAAQKSA